MWFASTLGLVHRTLHNPGSVSGLVASSRVASITEDQATVALSGRVVDSVPSHGLAALFGHHSDAECRLYDQLAHGASAPGVPLVVLPLLLPTATFAYLEGEALARWVLLLRARGPPFTR